MSTYRASVDWRLEGDFATRRYSRVHTIGFDAGLVVPGTAGPANVAPRYGRADAMDPEQAFVASLAACHMLWFLDVAARAGFVCESYRDEAEGVLEAGPEGKEMMTRIVLRPKVSFAAGKAPTPLELTRLHHKAHEACFIANSVKSEVAIEPR
ncbi:MAG TPA: OsmC family protein [Caulobacteraceae bacterium]|nr:OsmC family protein [Caulobacteraceae bacterium]